MVVIVCSIHLFTNLVITAAAIQSYYNPIAHRMMIMKMMMIAWTTTIGVQHLLLSARYVDSFFWLAFSCLHYTLLSGRINDVVCGAQREWWPSRESSPVIVVVKMAQSVTAGRWLKWWWLWWRATDRSRDYRRDETSAITGVWERSVEGCVPVPRRRSMDCDANL